VTRIAAAAAYIATIVAANLLTTHLGLIGIGPVIVTAGTAAIGLALVTRDWLHDTAGRWAVLAAITTGAALSALLAPAALAIASGVTFALAELADMAVYTRLRERTRIGAWIASNAIAAPVDSLLFLWLAGFPIAGWWGQTLVKVAIGTLIPLLLIPVLRKEHSRDLLRHRLHRAGA
jgi:hypothetical protein